MSHPDFNNVVITEEYFIDNPDFAMDVIRNYNQERELNASWYGPKIPFVISKPKLLDNAHRAKRSLRTKKTG